MRKKISFILTPVPPYSFDLQWRFYSSKEPQPEVYENGVWRRAFKIGDKLIPVVVTSLGTIEKPKLGVQAFADLDARETQNLAAKINDTLNLDKDLRELYRFMEKDKILRKIKRDFYGLRPPKIGTSIFEGIIRVIIQQQISLKVAYVMTGALVKRFGEKAKVGSEIYYDFPAPKVLAAASENELRKCKLSRQKASYIKEISQQIVNGYQPEKLKDMSDKEAIEELMKFKGIGRWSAELILVTTLGRMNLAVPDDLGARKAVSYFYFNNHLQSGDIVRKFARRWGKFQGWIIYYLICAYNRAIEKGKAR